MLRARQRDTKGLSFPRSLGSFMIAIPIRPAEPRDLAAITRIYDHAVRHGTASFEIEPPDAREMARRYESLRTGGYPYLVAGLVRENTGHAYARSHRRRP